MKQIFFLALVSFIGAIVLNFQSICFAALLFFIGEIIVRFSNVHERNYLIRVFHTLYNAGLLYAIACTIYMRVHDYEWLLAFDTINYFLPQTQMFIEEGNGNYLLTLKAIFEDYNIFSEHQYLYFAYTCLWGIIAQATDTDFYFVIQLSTLILFPFIGIFLYKILRLESFSTTESFKYAIYICLFSIVFSYSSQILRDLHVMLMYIIAFYITIRYKASLYSLSLLSLIIFLTFGLRVESGIFLCSFIPLMLLASIRRRGLGQYLVILSVIVLIVFYVVIQRNYQIIQMIYETNLEEYVNPIAEGTGMIGTLQKIPIIGSVLSILYNAVQPMPFWRILTPTDAAIYGGEAYNIMNITRATSSFVNLLAIIYILYWLFSKTKGIQPHKAFVYQLWLGIIFLYLQSAVMAQRRIMAYYCLYYIFALMIFHKLSHKERTTLNVVATSLFIVFQIMGIYIAI